MKYLNYTILNFFTLIFLLPVIVFAANIDIENKDTDVQVGDTVIFDVYLNSTDEINSIEGIIEIEGDYAIKTISTAGSIFDMWPNKPSYENGVISFAGGSASSVFGNRLKLFSIIVQIQSEEKIIFSADQVHVFLGDGLGTKIAADIFKKEVILPSSNRNSIDKFNELVLVDRQPPLGFEINIGRDVNTFDGKYFASFNTVDQESGIERYEVIEGDTKTPVLTGTTYILQDQTLKGNLIVRAIDRAGNVQVSEVAVRDIVSEDSSINWKSLSIALLILILVFLLSKKLKIKNVRI
jgi:hypothetical protein